MRKIKVVSADILEWEDGPWQGKCLPYFAHSEIKG